MKTLLTKLILIFLASSSQAQVPELEVSASARTYPLAALTQVRAASRFKVWGDMPQSFEQEQKAPLRWKYGFIRPVLKGELTYLFHTYGAQVDIAPISFFILSFGRTYNTSAQDLKKFDCDQVTCQGTWKADFLQGTLALAYEQKFLAFIFRRSFLEHQNQAKPFAEPTPYLNANARGDRLDSLNTIAGLMQPFGKFPSERAGVWYSRSRMNGLSGASEYVNLFYLPSWGRNEVFIGAGYFKSDLVPLNFSANVSWNYRIF